MATFQPPPQISRKYPQSYEDAANMFADRGTAMVDDPAAPGGQIEVPKERKRLSGTDTTLWHEVNAFRGTDRFVVQFHESDLVFFYPDGSIFVDTCGWKADSTMMKINACLLNTPFQVVLYAGQPAIFDNRVPELRPFKLSFKIDGDDHLVLVT